MKNMPINSNCQSKEELSVSQLMQSPFVTGSLVVNFNQNKITLYGEELTIQPKVLELLIILCAANGRTLSKQELIDRLWADTVVGPDSLANTMTKLRKVLNDDPKKPVFIKTVQRKGYVWLASVKSLKEDKTQFTFKKIFIIASVLAIGVWFYYFLQSKKQPDKFPFPDLSIKKLDEGGYEIEVGIDGTLTKEKEKAMLAELKRITGEESSDMVFTVDEVAHNCAEQTVENSDKQLCVKDKNK